MPFLHHISSLSFPTLWLCIGSLICWLRVNSRSRWCPVEWNPSMLYMDQIPGYAVCISLAAGKLYLIWDILVVPSWWEIYFQCHHFLLSISFILYAITCGPFKGPFNTEGSVILIVEVKRMEGQFNPVFLILLHHTALLLMQPNFHKCQASIHYNNISWNKIAVNIYREIYNFMIYHQWKVLWQFQVKKQHLSSVSVNSRSLFCLFCWLAKMKVTIFVVKKMCLD